MTPHKLEVLRENERCEDQMRRMESAASLRCVGGEPTLKCWAKWATEGFEMTLETKAAITTGECCVTVRFAWTVASVSAEDVEQFVSLQQAGWLPSERALA